MANLSLMESRRPSAGLVNFSHSGWTTLLKTSVKQPHSNTSAVRTSETSHKMLKRSYSDVTRDSGTAIYRALGMLGT